MCGCGSTGAKYNFTAKGCGKKIDDLTKIRNQMATLYNVTKDPKIKEEYAEFRNEIEEIMQTYYNSKTCPEAKIITLLKQQVENEYTKYNNR